MMAPTVVVIIGPEISDADSYIYYLILSFFFWQNVMTLGQSMECVHGLFTTLSLSSRLLARLE